MSKLVFADWKPRASSFGKLMTNLPEPFNMADKMKLAALLNELASGVNENGNKTKWTQTKQDEVDRLNKKKSMVDELPKGAITELKTIFNHVYWKRRKILQSKYLDKGIIVESDSMDLLSEIDNYQYWKNQNSISNKYVQGTYDTEKEEERIVIDLKSNFELHTFQDAELTDLYIWQLKVYAWILGYRKARLVYALVNSPAHIIQNEINSKYYAMNQPQQDDLEYPEYFNVISQIERNHIFDIQKFREHNPNFDLLNTDWTCDIPAHMRIKSFDVELTDDDIVNMTRRAKLAQEWMINREKEEIELRYKKTV